MNLTGTLTNTNSTLALNATTGLWNFFGTVSGGTVTFADGSTLLINTDNTSGTFIGGVTLNNDLTVAGTNSALRVSGGMTLNAVIHVTGSNGRCGPSPTRPSTGRGRFRSRERRDQVVR